jgi:hypothetical protein
MKRSPLVRKTPLRNQAPIARRTEAKPRKTTPPKVRATPRPKLLPSALGRAHMGRVAELGCLICRRPAEVHHCRHYAGGGQRATDFHTIPLCPTHHRLGGSGVAFHAGPQSFARAFGLDEPAMLLRTLQRLGFEAIAANDLPRADLGALLYPERIAA